ncbi:hypothetical protein FGO68_gene3594 [Halteria grandinella]|uniref:Uncharacterized protein n=1 Tax=Halteria grandinella TaxID=5974 RepID=A0A8J8NYU9_HALGN|nr:hypothetical protein FGO68_gene3594 [Halteria grandinella]
MLLQYLRQLDKMGIYHGDIKPANVFFDSYRRGFVTTDSGSLIIATGGLDKFFRSCYTEGYASKNYVQKIKAKEPLTIAELKMEDIYQYKVTINHSYMDRADSHSTSKTITKIIQLCEVHNSDMQILSAIVLTDATIILELVEFLRMLDNFPRFTGSFWGFFANCLDHSFALLQIPLANMIEKLPYDISNAEKYVSINYMFIMDEIQRIAVYTKGDSDKTNTRAQLLTYLKDHNKPHLWYTIILRLMDNIRDLHLQHKNGKQTFDLEQQIMKDFIDSLQQYDQIAEPAIREREREAMAECIVRLYSNYQLPILETQTNQHPAYNVFDMIARKTLHMLVSDVKKREKYINCIHDQINFYKADGIFK